MAPVGAVALGEYFIGVAQLEMTVFCTCNSLLAIFKSVGTPLLPSKSKPIGQPIITELYIDSLVFLLIWPPAPYKLLPTVVAVALGPTSVILLNKALVIGVKALPLASLSLSNPFDFEMSATALSRKLIPNCTLPLNPLSVSKSSSRPL